MQYHRMVCAARQKILRFVRVSSLMLLYILFAVARHERLCGVLACHSLLLPSGPALRASSLRQSPSQLVLQPQPGAKLQDKLCKAPFVTNIAELQDFMTAPELEALAGLHLGSPAGAAIVSA